MSNIKNISIPEPCHQSWQQMTPETNGRHCQQCRKIVTDFTNMTNCDIITYLSTSSHVCGRFQPHQLSGINDQLNATDKQVTVKLRGWAMLADLLSSVTIFNASAQGRQPIIQTVVDTIRNYENPATLGKIYMGPPVRVIKGVVNDNQGPIPGVLIRVDKTNLTTVTDAYGKFSLQVPASAQQFAVSFIGYDTQEVNITSGSDYQVSMVEHYALLGDVVMITKRPPFFKRVYYRFIKRPVHKIFM